MVYNELSHLALDCRPILLIAVFVIGVEETLAYHDV